MLILYTLLENKEELNDLNRNPGFIFELHLIYNMFILDKISKLLTIVCSKYMKFFLENLLNFDY